jgi:AraC family transcriptional regulator
MEMSLQVGADSVDVPAMPSPADNDVTSETDRVPLTLQSAVRLLTKASRALWSNQDEAHQCIVKAAALLQAESEFTEPATANGANRGHLAPWQVKRVCRFIDDKLGDKIGIRELAAVARLGRSHFARAFRATVGEAPHAYLIQRRIERAQQLILLTDRPLAQIALDCGLTDQSHMTRLFRRVVGMSPGAWRRRHSSGARDLADSMLSKLPSRNPASADAASRYHAHS